ncbi:MAG: hypothetical protein C0524_03125 [Rhodobacter sp.]|nr:hypothetical protein [Rhodobacter sp.]
MGTEVQRHTVAFLASLFALGACASGTDRGAFPELAPIDDLLAQAGLATATDPGPALAARAAAVRARAANLVP